MSAQAVTREQAISFMETAFRNFARVPRMTADDIEDVRAELERRSAESADAIAELVEGLLLLLTPLERASHAMIAAGKVPDESAEATFDRARALIAKHRAAA